MLPAEKNGDGEKWRNGDFSASPRLTSAYRLRGTKNIAAASIFATRLGTGRLMLKDEDNWNDNDIGRFRSPEKGSKTMRLIAFRIGVAFLTFMVGLALTIFVNKSWIVEQALTYPVKAIDRHFGPGITVPPRAIKWDAGLPTEITLERVHDGCLGCGDKKIVLRTNGLREFEDAIVTEIDLQTGKQRSGRLSSYYHNNLMRLVESQGYFSMNDGYAMGWIDSTIVKLHVSIGDTSKDITTTNEGEVPLPLWGIYYAIEGVLNHVDWEIDTSKMVHL
jgi:hypothetical protein